MINTRLTLVALNDWVVCPDGKQYRAILGFTNTHGMDAGERIGKNSNNAICLRSTEGGAEMNINRDNINAVTFMENDDYPVFLGAIGETAFSDNQARAYCVTRESHIFDLRKPKPLNVPKNES